MDRNISVQDITIFVYSDGHYHHADIINIDNKTIRIVTDTNKKQIPFKEIEQIVFKSHIPLLIIPQTNALMGK